MQEDLPCQHLDSRPAPPGWEAVRSCFLSNPLWLVLQWPQDTNASMASPQKASPTLEEAGALEHHILADRYCPTGRHPWSSQTFCRAQASEGLPAPTPCTLGPMTTSGQGCQAEGGDL